MCTCKKDIEAKLLERFMAQAPDAKGHGVELQGYALAITDSAILSIPVMPFKTTAEYPKKSGGSAIKSKTSSMFFNYCPFCGVKIEKGGAA